MKKLSAVSFGSLLRESLFLNFGFRQSLWMEAHILPERVEVRVPRLVREEEGGGVVAPEGGGGGGGLQGPQALLRLQVGRQLLQKQPDEAKKTRGNDKKHAGYR